MNKVTSFFTLANFLTLSRIGLTPFIAYTSYNSQAELTLLLFFIGGLTDLLDGHCARSFDQTSKIGELLDPIADKIFFAGFFIALIFSSEPLFIIPQWFLIMLISRDLFLMTTGFFILKKELSVNLNPRLLGKFCTAWIMLATTFLLIEKACFNIQETIAPFLWIIAGGLLAASWIDYLINGIRSLKKA